MEHNGPQRTWTKQSTWTIVYFVFLLFSVRYEGFRSCLPPVDRCQCIRDAASLQKPLNWITLPGKSAKVLQKVEQPQCIGDCRTCSSLHCAAHRKATKKNCKTLQSKSVAEGVAAGVHWRRSGSFLSSCCRATHVSASGSEAVKKAEAGRTIKRLKHSQESFFTR